MTSARPTVSVLQITPVVEALAGLGFDTGRLLAQAGLRLSELQAGGRVLAETELLFWQAVVETSGDGGIGLRIAERLAPGALGSFEYLLRHSESLAELLERAQRYERLVDDIATLSVTRADGVATIRMGRSGNYPVPAAGTECLFAVVMSIARSTWPQHAALAVHFSHPRTAELERYRRVFGCPVSFEREANEILCSDSIFDLKAPSVDRKLAQVLEEHTAHLLAQLPAQHTFVDEACAKLRALLQEGRGQADALARSLGVSERTLRRKLAAEGASFQGLLDDLRRSHAVGAVAARDTSFEALATQLGFGDVSAFYRAFKRWTGTTPAQYRRARNADAAGA